jgi:hypothetical protein
MTTKKDFEQEFPFEYCATRFLLQWQRHELMLYEAFSSNPTKESISKALAYFRVSRNFPDLKKTPNKLIKIKNALMDVKHGEKHQTSCEKVIELSRKFEEEFNQFNLSAATKLLWLSYRSPYIVYDKRAVKALKQKYGHKFDVRDYDEYSSLWRAEYNKVEPKLKIAIKNLPNGRPYMPNTSLTDTELTELANQSWFKERVFDIFLWEVGGDI